MNFLTQLFFFLTAELCVYVWCHCAGIRHSYGKYSIFIICFKYFCVVDGGVQVYLYDCVITETNEELNDNGLAKCGLWKRIYIAEMWINPFFSLRLIIYLNKIFNIEKNKLKKNEMSVLPRTFDHFYFIQNACVLCQKVLFLPTAYSLQKSSNDNQRRRNVF